MYMNVACPTCGSACRVPESALGQVVACPACTKRFQCGTVAPRSLVTRPVADPPAAVHETPTVRAADGVTEERIHYRCPKCSHALESPAHLAGTKTNCPSCNQRLQIPRSSAAARPAHGSLLGTPQSPSAVPVQLVDTPMATMPPAPLIPTVTPVATPPPVTAAPPAPAAPARGESCLECGIDLTHRARVQTCPDCGSIFCSAGCYREHRYHAHSSRR